MLNLKEIRRRAKMSISRYYAPALIAPMMHFVASVLLFVVMYMSLYSDSTSGKLVQSVTRGVEAIGIPYPFSRLVSLILQILVYAAWVALLIYPLSVSKSRFFIHAIERDYDMTDCIFAYKKCFKPSIKLGWERGKNVFIWSLIGLPLLCVPGVITHYKYSMAKYIMAENPEISVDRALDISADMTKDCRGKLFLLDLSVAWTYVLGALLALIGLVFVLPYPETVRAEAYLELRKQALQNALATEEELPGLQYRVKLMNRIDPDKKIELTEEEQQERAERAARRCESDRSADDDDYMLIMESDKSPSDASEADAEEQGE